MARSTKNGRARRAPATRAAALAVEPGRALVQRIDNDHVLVVGKTALAGDLGSPIQELDAAVVARYLTMAREDAAGAGGRVDVINGGANVLAHAASLLQGIQQSGTIYRVAESSRPLFQTLQPAMSGKQMLGVLKDANGTFAHVVRWESAGAGLRSLASLSGLKFTVAVIAGQSRMFKSQQVMMHALGDLVDAHREAQFAEVRAKSQRLAKFLTLVQQGHLTPSVLELLPDQEDLQILVNRADAEVERRIGQLQHLPKGSRERLPALQRVVPDIVAVSVLYVEAEHVLSATEQLKGMALFAEGEVSAEARMKYEAAERDQRLQRQEQLSDALTEALDDVAEHPGSGWFTRDQDRKTRKVAKRTRADLTALRSSGLPTLALDTGD